MQQDGQALRAHDPGRSAAVPLPDLLCQLLHVPEIFSPADSVQSGIIPWKYEPDIISLSLCFYILPMMRNIFRLCRRNLPPGISDIFPEYFSGYRSRIYFPHYFFSNIFPVIFFGYFSRIIFPAFPCRCRPLFSVIRLRTSAQEPH